MRETNKDELKKAYRGEKDSRIRARIPTVHVVRVRKKGIGETATDLMRSEGWVHDWLKRYDEGDLGYLLDLPWPGMVAVAAISPVRIPPLSRTPSMTL